MRSGGDEGEGPREAAPGPFGVRVTWEIQIEVPARGPSWEAFLDPGLQTAIRQGEGPQTLRPFPADTKGHGQQAVVEHRYHPQDGGHFPVQ